MSKKIVLNKGLRFGLSAEVIELVRERGVWAEHDGLDNPDRTNPVLVQVVEEVIAKATGLEDLLYVETIPADHVRHGTWKIMWRGCLEVIEFNDQLLEQMLRAERAEIQVVGLTARIAELEAVLDGIRNPIPSNHRTYPFRQIARKADWEFGNEHVNA
jgi:hypothetical protein